MPRAQFINIDVQQLSALAGGLAGLTGETLRDASVNAVNEVAQRVEPDLRNSIVATINLSDQYIKDRMTTRLAAKGGEPMATITAPFRNTPLSRYDPSMKLVPVKNPGRAKGNAALGIPKGLKLAGISVEVVRGERKFIQNSATYFDPSRRDSNGNPMIFQRKTAERFPVRVLYGPSVYQLFRVARDNHMDEITTDLELTLLAEAEAALDEALT